MGTPPPPGPIPPPRGRDEVREAILEAAGRHFAAKGLGASLREIAAEAQVNLGLIHRHFGNKDDLLRAVIQSQSRAGTELVAATPDLGDAVREVFRRTAADGRYTRILAWLLLADEPTERFHQQFPTIGVLRERAAGDDRELALLAAFAATYGWAVFGGQLMAAFGYELAERAGLEERLGALVARLVELSPAPPAAGDR